MSTCVDFDESPHESLKIVANGSPDLKIHSYTSESLHTNFHAFIKLCTTLFQLAVLKRHFGVHVC